MSPAERCEAAIAGAEQRAQLPPRLLRSIALVESGRADPATGRFLPWPWTINVAGAGHVFSSREDAIAAVRSFQARGVRSIDVGCAQVNLLHHPGAFESLEAAFDPQANADYAARFLVSLRSETGGWPPAVAAYHSRTVEFGYAYARKVRTVWPEADRYGSWPPAVVRNVVAPAPDPGIYTPEFAARLRRMDQDRARASPDLGVYTPEFAARFRQEDQAGGRRRPAQGGTATADRVPRSSAPSRPVQVAGREMR